MSPLSQQRLALHLQILDTNRAVEAFYLAHGYATERRIGMDKRFMEDVEHVPPVVPSDGEHAR